MKPDVHATPAWQVLSLKEPLLSFQFDWRLNTSSDRHVSFKDRAKFLPFAMRGPGPRLGQHLGPFLYASSTHKPGGLSIIQKKEGRAPSFPAQAQAPPLFAIATMVERANRVTNHNQIHQTQKRETAACGLATASP
ncbi:MAG: hypothetical protein WCD30_08795, partial [Pseudolabrys sp.]